MITLTEASTIIKHNLIDGTINAAIEWEDNWLFSVYTSDFDEGELDPFYAVNMKTGTFSGFSIVGDQDTSGILEAFSAVVEHGDTSDEFLAHYGKKGMRWGVRNDETGSKSGPSKASKNAEAGLNAIKPLLGPVIPRFSVIPKTIEIGAAIANAQAAGTTMKVALKSSAFSPLAIAGYAVTGLDSGAYRVPVVATKNLARGGWIKDKSLANPKMSVDDIQKKVASKINKDYPGLGTTNNCLRATYTYEMRRRGYDVAATKTILASGQGPLGPKFMTKSIHSKTKINSSKKQTPIKRFFVNNPPSAQQVLNTLAMQPDRSRGDLQMSWGPLMGGHSVAYEIVNKKPVIFDTQSGKTYSTSSELNTLTQRAQGLSFNRLDNKNLNTTAMAAWMKDS